MLEIKEDKSFLSTDASLKSLGLEYETVGKLCFQVYRGFERSLFVIKEWLEENFRMYQYKKGNGVKYGEHELFYWHRDGDDRYFTVNITHKNASARRITEEVIAYLAAAHSGAEGCVVLQYEDVLDWAAVNRFVTGMDVSDKNGLPLSAIARIAGKSHNTGDTLTPGSRDKLSKLEAELLGALRDKRVSLSTWRDKRVNGTLRQLDGGGFALFESRARKTYIPVSLRHIA
ncbi:MAG: hypothetical protein LBL15_06775, partial [Oscillospiraceae bacterium]|nr:hypothetical protein [Oscillospiraceae bacterium]